jgi:porphobilinogen deaminase
VQCRTEDLAKYKDLFCTDTKLAVTLEKAFLKRLGSGCQIPVGAYFKEGLFRIYHPEVGHRTFEIMLTALDQVEPELELVMEQLAIT